MLLEDSAQFTSQKNPDPCQPSGRHDIPSGRPTVQSIIRSDDENFPSKPSHVSRSFELLQLASVRTFQQHIRTTLSVRPSFRISFQNTDMGRSMQVSHSKSWRPDASQHGPDARALDMEIMCIKSTIRTVIPLVRTREAFICKLLAAKVRSSGRQGNTVQTRLKNRK
jgi:hypothetical protein